MIPDAHLQYFFNKLSILLNYRSPQMIGKIPPTDSRNRNDIRLYEIGSTDEADEEKLIIETEQRRKRKLQEEGHLKLQPLFFEESKHPFVKENTFKFSSVPNPVRWTLKESKGDFKSYWDRREAGDWKGMPDLWTAGGGTH